MANTISTQTLHDGYRNLITKTDIIGDGSGDESATTLIDISTFASIPGAGAPTGFTIQSICSTIEGFTVRLLWNADTDTEAIMIGQGENDLCFEKIGGLTNDAGTGVNGDLNITTTDLGSGDTGSIILKLTKQYG